MFDILCAKNAGVTSVLVGWSLALRSGDDLGEDAPDHVIRKAGELLELL